MIVADILFLNHYSLLNSLVWNVLSPKLPTTQSTSVTFGSNVHKGAETKCPGAAPKGTSEQSEKHDKRTHTHTQMASNLLAMASNLDVAFLKFKYSDFSVLSVSANFSAMQCKSFANHTQRDMTASDATPDTCERSHARPVQPC